MPKARSTKVKLLQVRYHLHSQANKRFIIKSEKTHSSSKTEKRGDHCAMSFLEKEQQTERRLISIRPLKQFVLENLRITSATRAEILSEPDHLTCNEYLTLLKVWLTLLRFDTHVSKQNEGIGA
jgi:hypothetical protein